MYKTVKVGGSRARSFYLPRFFQSLFIVTARTTWLKLPGSGACLPGIAVLAPHSPQSLLR